MATSRRPAKPLACGTQGCVYDNDTTIIKKANGPISLAAEEIEFGKWVGGQSEPLALVPILAWWQAPGLIPIPIPRDMRTWPATERRAWMAVHRQGVVNGRRDDRSGVHHELVYPKLQTTMRDRYWTMTRKARYMVAITLLETMNAMSAAGWFNPDVHLDNLMWGRDGAPGLVAMIDYGSITRDPVAGVHGVLGVATAMGGLPLAALPPGKQWMADSRAPMHIMKSPQGATIGPLVAGAAPRVQSALAIELALVLDPATAMETLGYSRWLKRQSPAFRKRYGRRHERGLTRADHLFLLAHLNDLPACLTRLRESFAAMR